MFLCQKSNALNVLLCHEYTHGDVCDYVIDDALSLVTSQYLLNKTEVKMVLLHPRIDEYNHSPLRLVKGCVYVLMCIIYVNICVSLFLSRVLL